MSYNIASWIRVARGFQKVGKAAAIYASDEGSELANRIVHHGVDLGTRAQTQAMRFTMPMPMALPMPMSMSMPMPDSEFKNENISERQDAKIGMTDSNATVQINTNDDSLRRDKEIEVKEMEQDKEVDMKMETEMTTPDDSLNQSYDRLREGSAVPSTRIARAFGFASLGFGLAVGSIAEATSRIVSSNSSNNSNKNSPVVASDANADRLAASLCRMRGAALKMGQMLSIQDESLLPPALSRALQQVRQGADAMPKKQLLAQLEKHLGEDWKDRFLTFDDLPFAAASIGQVHRATLKSNQNGKQRDVVVKVQYPGVADSIDSDLGNLTMLVKMTGLAPKGLFIDNVIRVGRDELKVECHYLTEMKHQQRFQQLVHSDKFLSQNKFVVPSVISDLTTPQIITSEFAPGGTIDKVSGLSQQERNRIGRAIFYLTIQELFVWRFMQTDPNWGNFLYDIGTGTTTLIDFGAAREYSKDFVDGYLRIVWANANRDEETLMEQSHRMGFLTGHENSIMLEAHKQSGFTLGEPFQQRSNGEPFDFRGSKISTRLSEKSSAFLRHRLTPPPEEVYTLHRKLAGAYMLCIKLGAVVHTRDLLETVIRNHTFEDGLEPPKL